MFAISKELYEIDRLVILDKFEDMNKFFSITRNFSLKVHGHLKILCHLVNNLVESNDWLELLDTPLKMPNLKNRENTQKNMRNEITLLKDQNNSNVDPKNEIFDKILSSFQNENKKLWDMVKKGEDDTKFLKSYVEKIIVDKSQGESRKLTHEIVNNIDYPYDRRKSNININTSIPYQQDCNHNYPCNCKERFFKNNSTYFDRRERDNIFNNNNNNEVEFLKNELEKYKEELRKLNGLRKEDEDEFKNLIEEKLEQDGVINNKNNEIKRLKNAIDGLEDKVFNFEDEIEELRNNLNREKMNRKKSERDVLSRRSSVLNLRTDNDSKVKDDKIKKLKDKNKEQKRLIRRLKKNQNKSDDKPDFEFFEKENVILKKDIDSLKTLNNDLNNKNEQLVNLIEKNERTTTITTSKYNPDLLKCIYAQACYIEESEQTQRSFYSQKY